MVIGDTKPSARDIMKVLIVSGIIHGSGFVVNEVLRLSKRGVRIHVARGLMSIRSKERNQIVQSTCVHNFSRIIDPSLLPMSIKSMTEMPPTVFFHPKSIAAMIPFSWFATKLVRTHSINLIHAHFAIPEGFAGMMAKHETHKPLIVTLHGYDIMTEPSIGYGARLIPCLDLLVRKVLKEADVIIAPSTTMAEKAQRISCCSEKVVLIPNSVDTTRFNPNVNGGKIRDMLGINQRPMVFTLRAHRPKYGIEYLIKAARLVLEDKPDVVFVIGGRGPLSGKLEKLARDLRIAKSVIFTGYIHRKEVPHYYAACDLFVIPSLMEGLSIVVLEAMASGKPVIGTNVGGAPDQIKNGINGYLVEPKDPKGLADKIIYLIKNPNLMKRMGKEGRRMAEENFDINKRIDKILTIYSKLID